MKALVTGATGFVGVYLTRALLERGHTVRVMARTLERAAPLAALGAEVRLADVGEPSSLSGVAAGIDTVFHLVRSPTAASEQTFERIDVLGTEQLLREAERAGVGRFVYVSTLAGYAPPRPGEHALFDERTRFDRSGRLGGYARAKARAETVVLAANRCAGMETVIVRLGLVCGVGATVLPAHVCQPLARDWVILFGDGSVPLPLTYIDNAVDAMILAADSEGVAGESFNIVDDEVLTQGEYLALLQRVTGGSPRVLRVPKMLYGALGLASELAARIRNKEPTTNRYRIRARLAQVRFDCAKAHRVLKWRPRVSLREGLERLFRDHASKHTGGG
jgi:nucleoside-diphosphate-sugar epimerase